MINIGTSTINAVKLGTTNISAVYIGTTRLFPALDWFYLEDASGSANTVSIVKNDANAPTLTIETSTNGYTWTTAGTTGTTALNISVPANGKVYVRCSCTGMGNSNYYNRFTTATGDFKVGGNAMSMLYGSNFTGRETSFPTGTANAFYGMFSGNTHLVDASDLELPATTLGSYCYNVMFRGTSITTAPVLPATTLASYCYCQMFQDCTALTTAPTLPATTLAQSCYASMFRGCTALTTAPVLNATTLVENCYQNMLRDCTALTSAPALPAMTLATGCYQQMFMDCSNLTSIPASLPATTLTANCYNGMFAGCTSLTTAPALNATTLSGNCYQSMFSGCTALTSAPALPATTMLNSAYYQMFQNCSALTVAPALPATTLATSCYGRMFQGCTALTTAPMLPVATLVNACYWQMFYGCTHLNSITCLATDITATNCTAGWVNGVAATGTFRKDYTMYDFEINSNNGIPTGWTIRDANAPDYTEPFYLENPTNNPTTVQLVKSNGNAPTLSIQTSLDGTTWTTWGSTSTTALNITVPANGKRYIRCNTAVWANASARNYFSTSIEKFNVGGNIMSLLYGSSFTGAETALPWVSSGSGDEAFRGLFMDNTKLYKASALLLPATTLLEACYASMFNGCTALIAAPALPATTFAKYCCKNMFKGCTHLTSMKVAFTSWPNMSSGTMTEATYEWTYGLPASGTFYKKSGLSMQMNAPGNTTTGQTTLAGYCNAIPYNWMIVNY